MKTVDTRFGLIQFDPSRTIVFTQGMLGFEHLKHFVFVPTEKDDFLFCLQSVEDGSVAFLLVDPTRYFPAYSCPITAQERTLLNVGPEEDVLILTTITVHQDRSITLNLTAPVLIAPASSLAMQIVLEDGTYSPREPLPDVFQ
ncbi:MAG: flagellar assembly protein FliW [Thermodesulfobacteriota bacterium]